ncbi:hypothetical protein [Gordonia sp. CPCC 205333]|uniref:hypothetical protein n=1 Tax=Gordonia sp. CPCC 205333 TaxID=3140790 RepID=UPI003AF38F68
MLSLAIATTLVGFALLVVGLVTSQVWIAIACIAVCLIGVGLLVADVLRSAKVAKAEAADDRDSVFGADIEEGDTQVGSDTQVGNAPDADVRVGAPNPPLGFETPAAPSPSVVRHEQPPIASGVPQPSSQAARLADEKSASVAEGTFSDYVAATTGTFNAASDSVQPRADEADTGPVPRVDATPGVLGSGVRWESSIAPAQSEFIDRAASNWSTSTPVKTPATVPAEQHLDGSTMHPRPSVTRSRHRETDGGPTGAGASGMPKFDPLDPNWHPPPE